MLKLENIKKKPSEHLFTVTKTSKSSYYFTLEANNPKPLLTREIKLSSVNRKSNSEWLWLHQKQPQGWGGASTSLRPCDLVGITYAGLLRLQDKDSLVLVHRLNQAQILLHIYKGFCPKSPKQLGQLLTENEILTEQELNLDQLKTLL